MFTRLLFHSTISTYLSELFQFQEYIIVIKILLVKQIHQLPLAWKRPKLISVKYWLLRTRVVYRFSQNSYGLWTIQWVFQWKIFILINCFNSRLCIWNIQSSAIPILSTDSHTQMLFFFLKNHFTIVKIEIIHVS